jgi:Undecaprenyl-phosphate galactose phosphotransferase WbaP
LNTLHFYICALALLLADLLAWGISYLLTAQTQLPFTNLLMLASLWVFWSLLVRRSYFRRLPFWTELHGLFKGALAFMALGSLTGLLAGVWQVQTYAVWGLALAALLPSFRASLRQTLCLMGVWHRPAVIFGAGENAQQAALALQSEPSMGYALKTYVVPDDSDHDLPMHAQRKAWPKTAEDFAWLRQHQCVVALEASQSDLRDQLIRQLSQHQVKRVSVIPAMRGVPLFGLQTTQFFSHEVLMIHVRNQLSKPLLRGMKRVFDITGAAALLLLLSPLFAYVAYKVSRDGGSAFFGHERIGQDGHKFKCYKFRSMIVNAQEVLRDLLERDPVARAEWEKDFKLKNDPRINPIGHFLRRTSLDELPQLWNVLMGEMSLVGPRPVVQAELERYGDDVVYYLMAKPGMTGLWQVSGRNDVDYDTRVYFDAWYVKNWSLWTDIAILFKTVSVVTGKRGAY